MRSTLVGLLVAPLLSSTILPGVALTPTSIRSGRWSCSKRWACAIATVTAGVKPRVESSSLST